MSYTVTATPSTTSVVLRLTVTSAYPADMNITLTIVRNSNNQPYGEVTFHIPANTTPTLTHTVVGLRSNNKYVVYDGVMSVAAFYTNSDLTPRAATQSQWENLADRASAIFGGTDGVNPGTSGRVPAPAATDMGKFLKSDGTWDTAGGGGPTVVQTTGTSQTDVMSQKATTSMVFADPSTKRNIVIGDGASATNYGEGVAIGRNSYAQGTESVAIGKAAGFGALTSVFNVCIGSNAGAGLSGAAGSISLGAYSKASSNGEMNIGSSITTYGYNSSNYRLLSGLYDGQGAHDAVTVGQVNGVIDAINTALSINISHIGA